VAGTWIGFGLLVGGFAAFWLLAAISPGTIDSLWSRLRDEQDALSTSCVVCSEVADVAFAEVEPVGDACVVERGALGGCDQR
jgi:hypothetical protein